MSVGIFGSTSATRTRGSIDLKVSLLLGSQRLARFLGKAVVPVKSGVPTTAKNTVRRPFCTKQRGLSRARLHNVYEARSTDALSHHCRLSDIVKSRGPIRCFDGVHLSAPRPASAPNAPQNSISASSCPSDAPLSCRGPYSQAAVWLPAVVVPPRLPLSCRLPCGQRRELLWTIARGAPCFEARVEVHRLCISWKGSQYFSQHPYEAS